jgi:hypothetical protein
MCGRGIEDPAHVHQVRHVLQLVDVAGARADRELEAAGHGTHSTSTAADRDEVAADYSAAVVWTVNDEPKFATNVGM